LPAGIAATDANNRAASGGNPAMPDDVLMGPSDFLVVHSDFHEIHGSVYEKIMLKINGLSFP
jgi:hypothetical protein